MHNTQILALLEFFSIISQNDSEFDKVSYQIRKNFDLAMKIFENSDLKIEGSIAEAISNYGISQEKAESFERDLRTEWPTFFKSRIRDNHHEMRLLVFELDLLKSREYKNQSFYGNIRKQHEYLCRKIEALNERILCMDNRNHEYVHLKESLSRLVLLEKRSNARKSRFEQLEDLVNEEAELLRLQAMYVKLNKSKIRILSGQKRSFRIIEN